MEKYEIEHQHNLTPEDECLVLISMLTGYPLEEVREQVEPRLRKAAGWYGRDFIATFRKMGYDCSPKFKPFDKDTPYPCLMRYGPSRMLLARETVERRREKGNPDLKPSPWWNVLVYYDGLVYDLDQPAPFPLHHLNPDYRITSMLQVWVSNL